MDALRNTAAERRLKLSEMERELPAGSNGSVSALRRKSSRLYSRLYLSIILGSNLNVSLLTPDERYRYKEEYERFKVTVTYVMLAMLFLAYMFPFRYGASHVFV